MKLRFGLATLTLLGLCISTPAATFHVEVAYFDRAGGPLTVTADNPSPLPDGCFGQVIVDVGNDGIAPPTADGAPGAGDLLYQRTQRGVRMAGTFRINGDTLLATPGCFWADPGIQGADLPIHRIFVRIWNAPEPTAATAYWDSPLYDVLPGNQQMIFQREVLTCHPFTRNPRIHPTAVSAPDLGTYPNPFNSSARIRFELAEAAPVTLAIFDTQGRRVATLVDEPLAKGSHERRFDASGLPSGLYFASLKTGGHQQAVQKLVLVK